MKQIVRCNTFETNSSSTHSLILMSIDDYNKFLNGELLYDCNINEFINSEDLFLRSEWIEYLEEIGVENIPLNQTQKAINDFICDNYYDFRDKHYMDIEAQEVYDKDGNKQMAVSMYISE